ncbi:MAG: DUF4386 domain-containing protein [Oscillospiraceae bacterium]
MREANHKKNARIVGILYILGTVAGIISVPFLSIQNTPDYLTEIGKNPMQLQTGALLLLAMGFSLALIPAFAFPTLKKYNEPLGIAYIIFRGALETGAIVLHAVFLLLLSSLGAGYAAGTVQSPGTLYALGELLKNGAALPITKFAFELGALLFYTALFQYRLLPKWISLWGILAILLHIAAGILVLLGLQKDMDTASLVMNLPIAVQEMVMAVWLVAKGFNTGEQSP